MRYMANGSHQLAGDLNFYTVATNDAAIRIMIVDYEQQCTVSKLKAAHKA